MLLYSLESRDPALNLAQEEALLDALEEGSPSILMLWRNGPSVILGRHQNALEEVNMAAARARGVPVVRRSTGGGAVYHDLGNLNYSFLEWRPQASQMDFSRYLDPVVRALGRLGVEARPSGRNDLEAGGRKISGSAQRLKGGRVLHHGTLLVNLDFEAMAALLTPDAAKYQSKGVASIKARVGNISELWRPGSSMEELMAALAEEAGAEPAQVPGELRVKAFLYKLEKYGHWKWNVGRSPAFTVSRKRRFPWGSVQLCLKVKAGVVETCRIYGDFFAAEELSELEGLLEGLRAGEGELERALRATDLSRWFPACDQEELGAFLAGI